MTFVNEGAVFAHFTYIHIIEYLGMRGVSFVQQVWVGICPPEFAVMQSLSLRIRYERKIKKAWPGITDTARMMKLGGDLQT